MRMVHLLECLPLELSSLFLLLTLRALFLLLFLLSHYTLLSLFRLARSSPSSLERKNNNSSCSGGSGLGP